MRANLPWILTVDDENKKYSAFLWIVTKIFYAIKCFKFWCLFEWFWILRLIMSDWLILWFIYEKNMQKAFALSNYCRKRIQVVQILFNFGQIWTWQKSLKLQVVSIYGEMCARFLYRECLCKYWRWKLYVVRMTYLVGDTFAAIVYTCYRQHVQNFARSYFKYTLKCGYLSECVWNLNEETLLSCEE